MLKLGSMRSCTARARSSDSYSVMSRIMLRFRPIAPKPVSGDTASGTAEESKVNGGAVKRAKRKYVRVRGKQSSSNSKQYSSVKKVLLEGENSGSRANGDSSPEKVAVTLQLLPERSDCCADGENKIEENWKTTGSSSSSFGDDNRVICEVTRADPASRTTGSVMETLVIVEGVTETFSSAGSVGLGFSDKERINSLQLDTCPAFVSDGGHNVVWVNDAYKKMVAAGEREEKGFLVWLVVKAELPRFCPSFACRVRLIQQQGEGQKWNRIVACDVWRMQFAAGFAWKLDVHTALGLGI